MKFPLSAEEAWSITEQYTPPQVVIDKFVMAIKSAAIKGLTVTTVSVPSGLNIQKICDMFKESGYNVTYLSDGMQREPFVSFTVDWTPRPKTKEEQARHDRVTQPTLTERQSRTIQYPKDWDDPEGVGKYRG